jgi:serine/threonine protein kinase
MEEFRKPDRRALVGDRYELGEELGRGAFGQVFKGTCIKTGEVVAVKQIALSGMSQDRLADIMQEIDLLKKLNHENIVKYIESFKTRSHLHIVLEYMEQGALSQLKDKWGVLKEFLISAFICQVLHGLEYLHAQGVVHRVGSTGAAQSPTHISPKLAGHTPPHSRDSCCGT